MEPHSHYDLVLKDLPRIHSNRLSLLSLDCSSTDHPFQQNDGICMREPVIGKTSEPGSGADQQQRV